MNIILRGLIILLSLLPIACQSQDGERKNAVPLENHILPLGQVFDVSNLSLKNTQNGQAIHYTHASPALLIAQQQGWSRLYLANGRTAWAESKQLSKAGTAHEVLFVANSLSVDASSQSLNHSGSDSFSWLDLVETNFNKLVTVSDEMFDANPEYIAALGRQTSLAADNNPFHSPQFQLSNTEQTTWLLPTNFQLLSNSPSNTKLSAKGIVNRTFLPLVAAPQELVLPPGQLVLTNILTKQIEKVAVKDIEWQLQNIIYLTPKHNSSIQQIRFYSSNKSTYLFALHTSAQMPQYFGYSGFSINDEQTDNAHNKDVTAADETQAPWPIDSPLLIDYQLLKKNNKSTIMLTIGLISGDSSLIEKIQISESKLPEVFLIERVSIEEG